MTPKEDTMTKAFIDDNLEKGYIQPSKSPMATPFFFVNKKGTSKKRPCQYYRYLNNWMVKRLPSSTYIRYNGQSQNHEILHQDGRTFRI